MNHNQISLEQHLKYQGKIGTELKAPLDNADDLSWQYTPGVAAVCQIIAEDEQKSFDLTCRGNTVAVITDGSAVLGLGNIGAVAAMPVMEGKCALFKKFAGVDAVPICLDTQDEEELFNIICKLAPNYGGINLEDISAPRCFTLQKRLQAALPIPVFHDDQDGTAVVTLAGLINACKVTKRKLETSKIVISGAGAAGISIARLLVLNGVKQITLCDRKGVLSAERENLNQAKKEIFELVGAVPCACPCQKTGQPQGFAPTTLQQALVGADIFIGVSSGNLLTSDDVAKMNSQAIVFAMANPTPEIMPDQAKAGGAAVVATGRSDFPNQVNNVLCFPGLFKGLLKNRLPKVTPTMLLNSATALAGLVQKPSAEQILPSPFAEEIAGVVAEAVK